MRIAHSLYTMNEGVFMESGNGHLLWFVHSMHLPYGEGTSHYVQLPRVTQLGQYPLQPPNLM